jgi:hypothetical protein
MEEAIGYLISVVGLTLLIGGVLVVVRQRRRSKHQGRLAGPTRRRDGSDTGPFLSSGDTGRSSGKTGTDTKDGSSGGEATLDGGVGGDGGGGGD